MPRPRKPQTEQPELPEDSEEQHTLRNTNEETLYQRLHEPLNPDHTKTFDARAGSKAGMTYIETWRAIQAANSIFGFGGWSYDVGKVDLVNTESGQEFYMAIVTVHALGVTRTDIGHGDVTQAQLRDKDRNPVLDPDGRPLLLPAVLDAYETALKGAVSDGLKRALRTFGAQFGNELYGDPSLDRTGGEHTPTCPLHGSAWFRTRRGDAHKYQEGGTEQWCNPWQGYGQEIRAAGQELSDERKAEVFRELSIDRGGYKDWSAAECERLIKGLEDAHVDGGDPTAGDDKEGSDAS